ncbi:probable disease resistance RPP8-like protein 4 [Macadamia integrifolia]|uniref:probable disease resistance RPP8-like protein 4 n=1 Tax=Macadamia integrifolia TaxID=60698 RepID=UPI001C4EC278|nr:probable disease resistance RPP8-like protein 4 [Macadamia integrifolia]
MSASAIIPLIMKLGSLLNDEANYLSQVKPEVESLHNELNLMTASLKDADAIHHKSERAKEWVRQLRELAFEVEDAIDVFVYEVMQRWQGGVVRKITKFPKLVIKAHQLRVKIQDINGKIKKLKDDRTNYDIKPLEETQTSTQTHQLEASSSAQNFRPMDVVGLQREVEEVAKLLMKEPLGQFGVVSITGMGGLGKTTLAQKVYNRDDVKKHFVCQACVRISKEYRMKDVLYNIIKQVMVLREEEKEALASKDVEFLVDRLSTFLKEKKNYLFLLDDVWTKEAWDTLKGNLPAPSNHQQCRVLLTTRDEGVARHADPIAPPYNLKLFDEKKSLKLFSKVFFQLPNEADAESRLNRLNKEMKDLAMDIVKKCNGLPLAIVVLGRLLSEKRLATAAEWKKVLDSVNWHLDSKDCQEVLRLSYTELPPHLKSCFLYFGVFPEDTEIESDRLIRLWVAEGFLERRGSLTMEDVAGECLEELMQRNLIQVAKWKSNGVPESFIIHDLLLNLAISEAKEGKFLNISTPQMSLNRYRRVALRDKGSEDYMTEASHHSSSSSSSKSLLCYTEMPPSLYGQFKLLNVLDLEDAPGIKNLPKEIGKLFLLKYLSLRGTRLKTLPPWVGNLYNLQTLNLFGTRIDDDLPIEILKLDKLRHLLCLSRIPKWRSDDSITKRAIRICRPSPPPRHLGDISHLQTLWLRTGDWIEDGLEKLIDLRNLRIDGKEGHMEKFKEKLSQALVKLERLEVLFLIELGEGEIAFPSFSNNKYLYDLYICGHVGKLPDSHNFPPSLTRLRLASTRLQEDMIPILEKLPKLRELTLDKQPYDGVVMKCSAGGFPKLEDLTLHDFHSLMDWVVEEEAMLNLRKLEINELYGLKSIPNGLSHITTLQELTLVMPKQFLERVKEGGKDWEKIKHVPSIRTREEEIPEEILQQFPQYGRQWVDVYKGDNPS